MTEVPMAEVLASENDCHPVTKWLMSIVGGIFSEHKPVVKKDVVPSVVKKDVVPSEQVVIVPPKVLSEAERAKAIQRSGERTKEAMKKLDGDLEELDWLDTHSKIGD